MGAGYRKDGGGIGRIGRIGQISISILPIPPILPIRHPSDPSDPNPHQRLIRARTATSTYRAGINGARIRMLLQ
jgi:hypothetical protein